MKKTSKKQNISDKELKELLGKATIEVDPSSLATLEDWSFKDVRWTDDTGTVRYGRVDTYDKGAKKVWKAGRLVVDDKISPFYETVPVDRIETVLKRGAAGDWDSYEVDQFVKKQHEAAEKLSASLPKGLHAGKLFSVGVADGCAFYVVAEVKGSRARVEWRGFFADRYFDHVLGSGGWFPKAVVSRLVGWEEARKGLFDED